MRVIDYTVLLTAISTHVARNYRVVVLSTNDQEKAVGGSVAHIVSGGSAVLRPRVV